MLSLNDDCIKITKRFLRKQKIVFDSKELEHKIYVHPKHPSLLCITDVLTDYGLFTATVILSFEQLCDLDINTIIPINSKDKSTFIIINNITDTYVEVYDSHDKIKKISVNKFKESWSGVAVIYEIKQDANEVLSNLFFIKKYILIIIIISIVFVFCFLGLVFMAIIDLNYQFKLLKSGLLFSTIIGSFLGVILLSYEIDNQNPYIKKICPVKKESGCEAILDSELAKLFYGYLTLSEIVFSYFFSSLVLILFTSFTTETFILLSQLSFLTTPFIVYSIYIQLFKIKQICILCLAIVFILIMQINIVILNDLFFKGLTLKVFLFYSFLFISFFFLWNLLKSFFIIKKREMKLHKSLNQLKSNKTVFESLLKSKPQLMDMPTDDILIHLGEKNSKISVLLIMDLFCKPCEKKLKELYRLVEIYGINLKIMLMPIDDIVSIERKKCINHFLALIQHNFEMINVLKEWYGLEDKTYETFTSKYPIKICEDKYKHKIEEIAFWCKNQKIIYTPTLFYCGYEFPEEYDLKDLDYILLNTIDA